MTGGDWLEETGDPFPSSVLTLLFLSADPHGLRLASKQKHVHIKDLGMVLLGVCLFYPPKHAYEAQSNSSYSKPAEPCLLLLFVV